jgi:uncharacterized membrane protein YdbT with pleckstrin-like domain
MNRKGIRKGAEKEQRKKKRRDKKKKRKRANNREKEEEEEEGVDTKKEEKSKRPRPKCWLAQMDVGLSARRVALAVFSMSQNRPEV